RFVSRTKFRSKCCGRPIVRERRQGHGGQGTGVQTVHLPRPLIGAEEKYSVFFDWPADGSPELILFQVWLRLSVGILEKGIGVKDVVAEKLPKIAVEVV